MTIAPFTTCLWFDGQAEEAAQYYVSVFPDGKIGQIVRVPEGGPGVAGSVLTVEFTINGQNFLGLNGGPQFHFDEAISFQILCENQEEIDHYWAKLVENGGRTSECGWLRDRYGLSWQVVPTELITILGGPDRERASRAIQVMMTMSKLDVAALRAA